MKEKFPEIKFSVRKSSGSAINISYTDGVPTKEVEKYVRQFESIDRCEYTGEILLGGNDYVFVNREISDEKKNEVKDLIQRDHGSLLEATYLTPYDKDRIVWEVYATMDFRKPVEVKLSYGRLAGNMEEKED